jgi:hypothetical protein
MLQQPMIPDLGPSTSNCVTLDPRVMYYEFHMRRGLSIFLILFFWLGPLAALTPGDEDSGLPACCRRHGAHHCAMAVRMAAQLAALQAQAASGSTPVLNAPATCPLFPGLRGATATTAAALAASPVGLPVLLVQSHSPAAGRGAALLSQIRTRVGRGPPALAHS